MYTTIRHELHHARKAWSGTLVYHYPCLLSGSNHSNMKEAKSTGIRCREGGGGRGREIERGIKRLLCLMAGGMGEREGCSSEIRGEAR